MRMHSPVQPGRIIRDVIDDLELSVTAAAQVLNVSQSDLTSLLRGKSGISPEMAESLSTAIGSTPGFWMRLQRNYDLAQADRRGEGAVVNSTPAR